jgi:hypothetical protein
MAAFPPGAWDGRYVLFLHVCRLNPLIVDVRATRQHQAKLAKLGMKDVARRRLRGRFLGLARLVTATKPERPM